MRLLARLIVGVLLTTLAPLACFQSAAQGQVQGPASGQGTEEIDEIRALVRQGRYDAALERVDAALAVDPRDAGVRFLKGVVFAESDRIADAVAVFESLTRDFPELPEPYNNLAVLHAAQGDYESARDALLLAISTHPSYSTAHENLGDIYAKMAALAYDRALELDTANDTAKAKLSLIDDLFSRRAAVVATQAQARRVPATVPAPAAPTPAPAPVASSAPAATTPTDPKMTTEVLDTVYGWARAWSAQNVDGYLGAYAPGFRPPRGLGRRQWERQRRKRLTGPRFIEVELDDVTVEMRGVDRAWVTFRQSYRSDTFADSVRKRLGMARSGNAWKILSEQSLP